MRRNHWWKGWLVLALATAVGPLGACDRVDFSTSSDDDEEESDDDGDDEKGKKKKKKGDKADDGEDGDDAKGKKSDEGKDEAADGPKASGAGEALSASALKYLPEGAELVLALDLARARESGVWKMGAELLGELGKSKAKEAKDLEDARAKLEELEKDLGFDPIEDISRVTMAMAGMGTPDMKVMVVAEGKGFDEAKIVATAEKRGDGDEKPGPVEKVAGVNVHWNEKGDGGWAVVSGDLLVAASKGWMNERLDGKGKGIDVNEKLMAAVKRVDGNAALFLAMPVTGDMTAKMKDAPFKGIEEFSDLAVSIVLDEGLKAVSSADFGKDTVAKEVKDQIAGLALMMLKEMGKDPKSAFPCKAEAMKMLETYKLDTSGTAVLVTFDVTKELLADAKACAIKDGAKLLPEMPIDELPMMEDSSAKIGDKAPKDGVGGGAAKPGAVKAPPAGAKSGGGGGGGRKGGGGGE